MNISNRLPKAWNLRDFLLYMCVLMLLLISVVDARPGRFGNNSHNGGFNPGGNHFGSGSMKFNQGSLKMGARHNFGQHHGSGYGSSPISVSPVGGNFGGTSATGSGGSMSSGGAQPATGPSNIGSSGFGSGPGNNGCMSNGPSNNTPGGRAGIGGKHGFVGGYSGNGFVMTKHDSDVIIRTPFGNRGKSTGNKGGAVFGCGDAFSKVLSGPDCKGGSFNKPGPVGPKGPKLNCSPYPKKCDGNKGWEHGKKTCGKKQWGKGKKSCKNKKWRWRWKWHRKCKPCCPHDDDNDTDADVDTDFDTDFDCDNDIDTDFDCDMDLDLDNDTDDDVVLVPAAPLWNENKIEFAGCPALMKWLAAELSVPQEQIQIYIVNPRTSFRDINPCDMCARLQSSALILHDRQDIYLSALTEVLDEITAPAGPISPERMMEIAQRLSEPEPGSAYERAAKYISAAQTYVTILRDELGYTADGSFTLAAKYIGTIDDADVADYVTAQLINLGM